MLKPNLRSSTLALALGVFSLGIVPNPGHAIPTSSPTLTTTANSSFQLAAVVKKKVVVTKKKGVVKKTTTVTHRRTHPVYRVSVHRPVVAVHRPRLQDGCAVCEEPRSHGEDGTPLVLSSILASFIGRRFNYRPHE